MAIRVPGSPQIELTGFDRDPIVRQPSTRRSLASSSTTSQHHSTILSGRTNPNVNIGGYSMVRDHVVDSDCMAIVAKRASGREEAELLRDGLRGLAGR